MKKGELAASYITKMHNKLIPDIESEWRNVSDRRLTVFYVKDEKQTVITRAKIDETGLQDRINQREEERRRQQERQRAEQDRSLFNPSTDDDGFEDEDNIFGYTESYSILSVLRDLNKLD